MAPGSSWFHTVPAAIRLPPWPRLRHPVLFIYNRLISGLLTGLLLDGPVLFPFVSVEKLGDGRLDGSLAKPETSNLVERPASRLRRNQSRSSRVSFEAFNGQIRRRSFIENFFEVSTQVRTQFPSKRLRLATSVFTRMHAEFPSS